MTIKGKLVLKAYKLFIRRVLSKYKRILRMQNNLLKFLCLDARMATKTILPGEDEKFDSEILLFCQKQIPIQNEAIKKADNSLANNAGDGIEMPSNFADTLKKYKELNENFNKLRTALKLNMEPERTANVRETFQLYSETRKVYLYFKGRYRRNWAQINDANAFKLNIDYKTVANLVVVIAPFFFLAGVLYCQVLLSRFGIEIDNYLTTADYVNGSLKSIGRSSLYIIINMIGFFLGFRNGLKKTKHERDASKKPEIVTAVIIFASTALMLVTAFIASKEVFFRIGSYLMIPYVHLISERISRKFFKSPMRVYLSFVVCIALLSNVSFSALYKSEIIRNGSADADTRYIFESDTYENAKLKFIYRSNEYYFFFEFEDKTTIILPKSEVRVIKIGA